jgi:hypothetical protein
VRTCVRACVRVKGVTGMDKERLVRAQVHTIFVTLFFSGTCPGTTTMSATDDVQILTSSSFPNFYGR